MLTLFGHPDSGHAYKIKLLMDVAEIDHEYVFIDIFSPRTSRPKIFRKHARFGEVPLLLDGDHALTQSNAILLYLAKKFSRWGGEHSALLDNATEWLFWEANKIGLCLPQLRADKRFDDSRLDDGARDWLMQRYLHDVGLLNDRLGDTGAFITGDTLTIADFSICGYLFLADEAEVDVPKQVRAWLARLSELPHWQTPGEILRA
ncbi:MAG: glutathione S-transferase family protein [Woeseiaceae bacterium]